MCSCAQLFYEILLNKTRQSLFLCVNKEIVIYQLAIDCERSQAMESYQFIRIVCHLYLSLRFPKTFRSFAIDGGANSVSCRDRHMPFTASPIPHASFARSVERRVGK